MLVINGQFPGPTIEANEGDTIVINVQNDMSNGTGIRKRSPHFDITFCILMLIFFNRLACVIFSSCDGVSLISSLHEYPDGMYQNGTNWADGVPGVSQCPIPAGSSFTYQFTVSGQYGTFWYHSHMGNTMADGLLVSLRAFESCFQSYAAVPRAP